MFERLEIIEQNGTRHYYTYESEEIANSGGPWISIRKEGGPLTKVKFRNRFTTAELVGIEMAKESHPDPVVRATLRVLHDYSAVANDINVSDPRTQEGVNYLVTVGLLDIARVPAILSISNDD